jgi:hypothetical protein
MLKLNAYSAPTHIVYKFEMDDKRYEINFLKGETFSYPIYNNNILSLTTLSLGKEIGR